DNSWSLHLSASGCSSDWCGGSYENFGCVACSDNRHDSRLCAGRRLDTPPGRLSYAKLRALNPAAVAGFTRRCRRDLDGVGGLVEVGQDLLVSERALSTRPLNIKRGRAKTARP